MSIMLANGIIVSVQKPPCIPSSIPFLGHAVQFGRNPIQFLLKAYKKVHLQCNVYTCTLYIIICTIINYVIEKNANIHVAIRTYNSHISQNAPTCICDFFSSNFYLSVWGGFQFHYGRENIHVCNRV